MKRIVLRHTMICHLLDSCNKELLKDPDNMEILKTRGIALNLAMKYEEAINDFIKVLKVFPGDVSLYYLKSDSHYELGEYEQAKQDFMRAALLEDNPDIDKSHIENVLVPEETELKEVETILDYERNKAILKNFPCLEEESEND